MWMSYMGEMKSTVLYHLLCGILDMNLLIYSIYLAL